MEIYSLPSLNYLRLRFHLLAQENCTLPAWKGSLVRGAFGHALRRTVCTMKKEQLCEKCMLRGQCAYTRMFETFITKPAPPFLKGLDTSPRPFILEPNDMNTEYREGDLLWFDLILVGEAANFLPYVVFAIMQMGIQGLGVRRHPFSLKAAYCFQPNSMKSVDDENSHWLHLYDGETQCILTTPSAIDLAETNTNDMPQESLKLSFLSQTRLKIRGELTMDFTFRMLVLKMIRRVLELAYFYMPENNIEWEFHDMLEAANGIEITARQLRWHDYQRYSNRQKSKMKMGGFIGDLVLEGELAPFRELLTYSEVVHVGKGATFGLGKIETDRR